MSQTDSWRLLRSHAEEPGEIPHLRELLADDKRCEKLFLEYDGIMLDYTRQARADASAARCAAPSLTPRAAQRVTGRTMSLLLKLAQEARVAEKIEAMYRGEHLNMTEDRAVRCRKRATR